MGERHFLRRGAGLRKLEEDTTPVAAILSAIRELTNPPEPKRRAIGFTVDLDEVS